MKNELFTVAGGQKIKKNERRAGDIKAEKITLPQCSEVY